MSHGRVGDTLMQLGKLDEALKSYRDSLAVIEHLSRSDPANTQWQHDLSSSYIKVSDVLVEEGKLNEALDGYRALPGHP